GRGRRGHSAWFAPVADRGAAGNASPGPGRAHAGAERGAAAPVPTPGTAGQATPPAPSSLEPSAPVTGEARPLAEALMDRLATDVHRDGARLAVVLEGMDMRMKRWQLDFWAARGVPGLGLAPLLLGAERAGGRTRVDGDPRI